MIRTALASLLAMPPLAGPLAPLIAVAALSIPTAILSLDHALPAGACCTTYFPFVLVSAVLIGPAYASLVAVASAGLADALFMGPRYQLLESPMDTFGDTASLISSALIICLVFVCRKALAERARPSTPADGVIFSRERGQVWASWYGDEPPICLGPERRVTSMMEDYLAQVDLAKRLAHRSDSAST
jgi:hypothetical protein